MSVNSIHQRELPIWPQSIAIAGAWGYIGSKFLHAAWNLGIKPAVFDPGKVPTDLPAERVTQFTDESSFYSQPADLFHLALPPQARRAALAVLLPRSRSESIAILNEKPMVAPEHPEQCQQLIDAVESSDALMLFDFLELFSPLTEAIVGYLAQFRDVTIDTIDMHRSKDREDVDNLRNYKVMTPIQYQESVHCLAWILYLLSRLRGGLPAAFEGGLQIDAKSEPYAPPNPQDYRYVVDGKCDWKIRWGTIDVTGRTDFKRHAPWSKRRIIHGRGDGRPFAIDADFLEGKKRLAIGGVDQHIDPNSNSYVQVIETYGRWQREVGRDALLQGIYPHPRFAQATYQLSSALWRASRDRRELRFDSYEAVLGFDAQFADEVPRLGRYG
jgi:predicted dehydrogenase